MKCGGCGWTSPIKSGYTTCGGCGGLLGSVEERDAYNIVLNVLVETNPRASQRYFDIDIVKGGQVIRRRHGWYDPDTGNVTQIG